MENQKKYWPRLPWISIISFLFVVSCLAIADRDKLKKEYNLGKIEYSKGNLDASLQHFLRVEKIESEYEDVPLYLAKIEYYKGNFKEANRWLETLLGDGIYGDQAQVLRWKCDYAEGKKHGDILREIGESLKKEGENLDLLLLTARIQEEQGQIPQAILNYERVLNESDKVIIAHTGLMKIYEKADLKDRAEYHSKMIEVWNQSANQAVDF